jgi:hypothetical protein
VHLLVCDNKRKIIVLCIKVIWFLDRKWEGKILLLTEDTENSYELSSAQPIHQTEIESNVFDAIESEQ